MNNEHEYHASDIYKCLCLENDRIETGLAVVQVCCGRGAAEDCHLYPLSSAGVPRARHRLITEAMTASPRCPPLGASQRCLHGHPPSSKY